MEGVTILFLYKTNGFVGVMVILKGVGRLTFETNRLKEIFG